MATSLTERFPRKKSRVGTSPVFLKTSETDWSKTSRLSYQVHNINFFTQVNELIVCVCWSGFEPVSIHTGTCVTTRTKSRCVFVDLLTPQMGVALAGNGFAAKACDYIGKMAADLLVTSSWNSDLPRDLFRFKTRSPSKPCKL